MSTLQQSRVHLNDPPVKSILPHHNSPTDIFTHIVMGGCVKP